MQIHQALGSSPTDPAYLDLLRYQNAVSNVSGLDQQAHHGHHPDGLPSCLVSYTFPPLPSQSYLPSESTPVSPLAPGPAQGGGNGFQFASQVSAPDAFASDSEDMSLPGSRVGSFDSLDSVNSMAISQGTQASSVADEYVWPVPESAYNTHTMANVISDLSLSGALWSSLQS